MGQNNKQFELTGVASMKSTKFDDHLQELVSRYGLTNLASAIGMDKGALSRFKNGEGNISMADLEALLDYADIALVPKRQLDLFLDMRIFDGELLGGRT